MTYPARFSFVSLDSSYDGSKLFKSDCLAVAGPFDTTISVGPAAGGTQQTIYHKANTICVNGMRIVSASTLFMTVTYTTSNNPGSYHQQVWKMNTDGSGKVVLSELSTPAGQNVSYSLNKFTQFPWSNFSRDSSKYTLESYNQDTHQSTLYTGSLAGGTPTTFADTTTGRVAVVGWSTL
jgi:hypothetical protein